MQFPYPLLVCDIGGTNARVALAKDRESSLELLAHLKTSEFKDLADAIRTAASNHSESPRSLIACAAGPLSGRALRLTNAAWTIDGPSLATELKLDQGLLLNDFEAQALALPALRPEWLRTIGTTGVTRDVHGPRVILGPGTGLGVAALLDFEGKVLPLSSEAGHMDFGPVEDDEIEFWPHLERAHGRVSAETVISGPGLVRVHRARMRAAGRPAPHIDGVAIVDRALQNRDGDEAKTVGLFWRLTARFAGDMALAYLAHGGVTLGGGVLPRMIDLLDPEAFRRSFEAKAPMDGLARSIATEVVVAPDAVLAGMAAIAADPDKYAIDYASRAWASPHAA